MPSFLGMLALASMVALASCAPALFRYADRRIGSDEPHPKSTGYPPVLMLALAFAAYAWLSGQALGWSFAGLVVAWCLWRTFGWKLGGSMTPRGPGQVCAARARHSMPALAYLSLDFAADAVTWLSDLPFVGILPLAAFALYATDLAVSYAHDVDEPGATELILKGINADNENHRGLAFGICFLLTVIICVISALQA